MALKRVVVTGLGALTPIGNNIGDFWQGLVNGKSGAAPITYFDTSKFKTKFACELKHFDISDLSMFPRKYDELINNYNYFRGFQVEGDGSVKPGDLKFD